MTDCQLCGEPVGGNGVDVLDMNRASEYVPWTEHADRRICVANIRADERKKIVTYLVDMGYEGAAFLLTSGESDD